MLVPSRVRIQGRGLETKRPQDINKYLSGEATGTNGSPRGDSEEGKEAGGRRVKCGKGRSSREGRR